MNGSFDEDDTRPIFVVEWESTIGLTDEGSRHEPVCLSFVSTVRAETEEAAQNNLIAYSDPSFRLRVARIEQLDEDMSKDELMVLLQHNRVFNIVEAKGGPVKADRD